MQAVHQPVCHKSCKSGNSCRNHLQSFTAHTFLYFARKFLSLSTSSSPPPPSLSRNFDTLSSSSLRSPIAIQTHRQLNDAVGSPLAYFNSEGQNGRHSERQNRTRWYQVFISQRHGVIRWLIDITITPPKNKYLDPTQPTF